MRSGHVPQLQAGLGARRTTDLGRIMTAGTPRLIEQWCMDYNAERLHSSCYRPPASQTICMFPRSRDLFAPSNNLSTVLAQNIRQQRSVEFGAYRTGPHLEDRSSYAWGNTLFVIGGDDLTGSGPAVTINERT